MTYDETRAGNPELSCGLTVGQHLEASPYLLPDPSSSPLRGEMGGATASPNPRSTLSKARMPIVTRNSLK